MGRNNMNSGTSSHGLEGHFSIELSFFSGTDWTRENWMDEQDKKGLGGKVGRMAYDMKFKITRWFMQLWNMKSTILVLHSIGCDILVLLAPSMVGSCVSKGSWDKLGQDKENHVISPSSIISFSASWVEQVDVWKIGKLQWNPKSARCCRDPGHGSCLLLLLKYKQQRFMERDCQFGWMQISQLVGLPFL